jgi:hypothetical protein
MSRCTCGTRAAWVVVRREFSCSAFDGYRRRPSDYSDVRCATCGVLWRTNAGYVAALPDAPLEARRRAAPSNCDACGKPGGPLLGPLTTRDGQLVHRDGCTVSD